MSPRKSDSRERMLRSTMTLLREYGANATSIDRCSLLADPARVRTFLDVTPIPVLFSERPRVVISAGLSPAWRLLGGVAPPHLDVATLRAWSHLDGSRSGWSFASSPPRWARC